MLDNLEERKKTNNVSSYSEEKMKEIRTERGPRIVLKRNIQGASSLSQLNARSKSNISRNGRVSYLTNTDSIIS